MTYLTTITEVAIHPHNVNPIYGDGVLHVNLADEAGGVFITLTQEGQMIRIDAEELPLIQDAIATLMRQPSLQIAAQL